jgi:hypothetical protein
MKYILDVKVSAKAGLFEAYDYYEAMQEGLGIRFLDAWDDHLDILQQNPLLFQKKQKIFVRY